MSKFYFILIISLFFHSCVTYANKSDNNIDTPLNNIFSDNDLKDNNEYGNNDKKSGDESTTTIPDNNEKKILSIINSLSLEEKVGQLFMFGIDIDENKPQATNVNEELEYMIKSTHPGGIILFGINISTVQQTTELIHDIQVLSNIPLFISTDQEGGKVSRLNESKMLKATDFPSQEIIGKTSDPHNAYIISRIMAEELKSLGINMNFAPVADLNTNSKSIIGSRAYGSDPEIAGKMVFEAVRGTQSEEVCAVLKHYPGHGDVSVDTHSSVAVIKHDLEYLYSRELIPFIKGIEAGVDGIMVAHIITPAITGDYLLPATLSRIMLNDILRHKMGFKGLIITDSIRMGGVANYFSEEEIVIKAIQAGIDIILRPDNPEKAYKNLLSAVMNGIISEKRIDESLYRILKVKIKRGILEPEGHNPAPEVTLGNEEHRRIVREIIEKATDSK